MKRLFGRLPPVSPTAAGLVLAASGLVVVSESWYSPRIACESTQDTPSLVSAKVPKNRLIFLGSGSSTGCPRPLCTMLFNEKSLTESGSDPVLKELRDQFQEKCLVSKRATVGNPLHNKDYRNNPSLLIAQYDENTGQTKHVVIDVGKTFREASLRWFPYHGIGSLHHGFGFGGVGYLWFGKEPWKAVALYFTITTFFVLMCNWCFSNCSRR
jgi:hypothetical protein